jgi:DNA-binding transcriptional LysR family regulator
MELKHLPYFKVLAEELNFHKAAEKLGISQPPLSQKIKELEDSLGTTLFYRLKSGNELSESGKILYQYTTEILDTLKKAEDHIQMIKERKAGSLQLGIVSGFSESHLSHIIRNFKNVKPQVDLSITENCSSILLQLVRDEKMDLALTYGPVHEDQLLWELITEANYVLIYGECFSESVSVDELLSEPLILHKRQDYAFFYDQIIQMLQEKNFKPNIISEISSPRMRVSLVQQNLGVSFVPLGVATTNHGIKYRLLSDLAPTPIGVVRKRKNRAPGLQEITEIIRAVFEK